jgi:hypothetical protein
MFLTAQRKPLSAVATCEFFVTIYLHMRPIATARGFHFYTKATFSHDPNIQVSA